MSDLHPSDESLMALVLTGDHEAFSVLVQRHTQRFFAAAYRMCGQVHEAEDIVQDAFVKLWQRPQRWNPEKGAKFTTWFYTVVMNTARDSLRRKKPQAGSGVINHLPDHTEAADEAMQMSEHQRVLEGAIQDLPERQKVALNLCFYEELSNKDAADIMGVGVKALESLLMRAKAAVRSDLIRQGIMEAKNAG